MSVQEAHSTAGDRPQNTWMTSIWFVLLTMLVSFYANIWNIPLFDLDEGAFSEATREMLASGNYIATYLDGYPRYDKPILIYWLQTLSVICFGEHEFSFRLPSVIAATCWGWAIYAFARDFLDQEKAKFAIYIFTTTLIVGIIARAATADALLNLFLTLSLFEIYRYLQAPESRRLYWLYLFLALGVLTKGPVIVFFSALISLLYCLINKKIGDWLRLALFFRGWLLLLAIVVPWVIAVTVVQGWDFLIQFIGVHNFGRFLQTMHGSGGSVYYYFVLLPLILLPYSGLFLSLLIHIPSYLKENLSQFLILWFLTVLMFFSLSKTQLPHYLLYGGPPQFLLMARYLNRLGSRWLAWLPFGLFLVVLLMLLFGLGAVAQFSHQPYERELLLDGIHRIGANYKILGLLALGLTGYIVLFKKYPVWQSLLIFGCLQSVLITFIVLPVVAEIRQAPVKEAALIARQQDSRVVAFKISMPSFSFYRGAITPRTTPAPGDIVFTRVDRLPSLTELFASDQQSVLYSGAGIRLIKIQGTPHGVSALAQPE